MQYPNLNGRRTQAMLKRGFALLIALIMLCMCGCAGKDNNQTAMNNAQTDTEQQNGQIMQGDASADGARETFPILGLIIDDDGSDSARLTMYGFLRTAETLCYASKVFRASAGEGAVSAVDMAKAEGITALMIFNPDAKNDAAIEKAVSLGMNVVVPYHECKAAGIKANIVADYDEYYDELARGLAGRMEERSLKSGRILVYGADTERAYEAFAASMKQNYPQYIVCQFVRTAADEEGAIDELADFILNNRDIKGVYAVDEDASPIAVKARSRAQKRFRSEGAPSPTPTPEATASAVQQPEYTPNPALLTQIMITVFGTGLSGENYKLFNDNDIYALCIEPYYEAAAQGTMTMDRIVRGESIAGVERVNRPIVHSDTADKYTAVYESMLAAFAAETN